MQVTHTARKSKNEFAAGGATCIKRGAISTVRDFICRGESVAALINPGERRNLFFCTHSVESANICKRTPLAHARPLIICRVNFGRKKWPPGVQRDKLCGVQNTHTHHRCVFLFEQLIVCALATRFLSSATHHRLRKKAKKGGFCASSREKKLKRLLLPVVLRAP